MSPRAGSTHARLNAVGAGTPRQFNGEVVPTPCLGLDPQVPVGFRSIRLHFDLTTSADATEVQTLIDTTEQYCVVLQTLRAGLHVEVGSTAMAPGG